MEKEDYIIFVIIVAVISFLGIAFTKAYISVRNFNQSCIARGGVPYSGPYQKSRCIKKESVIDLTDKVN